MTTVTPGSVLKHTNITEDYLCAPEDNVYGIDFTRFKIRDLDSKSTLFEIAKPPCKDEDENDIQDADPNAGRFVRYQFTPQVIMIQGDPPNKSKKGIYFRLLYDLLTKYDRKMMEKYFSFSNFETLGPQ